MEKRFNIANRAKNCNVAGSAGRSGSPHRLLMSGRPGSATIDCFAHLIKDLHRGEQLHALHISIPFPVTVIEVAWMARDIPAEGDMRCVGVVVRGKVREPDVFFSRPEEADRGSPNSRGDVHRAAIIGDIDGERCDDGSKLAEGQYRQDRNCPGGVP